VEITDGGMLPRPELEISEPESISIRKLDRLETTRRSAPGS
jgi:hypothetical protein